MKIKDLFKPRKKEDSKNFIEKTLPLLKTIIISIMSITLFVVIINGFGIIFNTNANSADPLVGLITIILSVLVYFISLIVINFIESIILSYLIIVENNTKDLEE